MFFAGVLRFFVRWLSKRSIYDQRWIARAHLTAEGKVREAGLEPATSRLSAGCSNRLSYPRNCKPADSPPRHKIDGAANAESEVLNAHSFSSLISLMLMYEGKLNTLSNVRDNTTSSRRSRVSEKAVIGTRSSASTPNSFWMLILVLTMTPL